MAHFFTIINGHAISGKHGVTIDRDRLALSMVLAGNRSPLETYLIVCRDWVPPVARAYALLGADAVNVLDRTDALRAGRTRGLLQ